MWTGYIPSASQPRVRVYHQVHPPLARESIAWSDLATFCGRKVPFKTHAYRSETALFKHARPCRQCWSAEAWERMYKRQVK